jgi:transposase InsO family protein
MKKKELPYSIFMSIMRRWQDLPHREKKKYLEAEGKKWGMSYHAIYRRIREFNTHGFYTPKRVDAGKVRVADQDTFQRDLLAIVGAQQQTKTKGGGALSTVQTLEVLSGDFGVLSQKYSASTINRHMRKLGLTLKNFDAPVAAVELIAKYPNHVWAIDATVAAQFYLREKGKILYDPELSRDTMHRDDRIRKLGLKKIWIYCIIDWFSNQSYIQAFADYHLGENSGDWFSTIKAGMLPKNNNILQGIPEIFYSDKGNPYKAADINRLTDFFYIQQEIHMPGNSRAKGKVERRIGVIKQMFERRMALLNIHDRFNDIEYFNHFLQTNNNSYCNNMGYSQTYQKYLTNLRTVTERDLELSLADSFGRSINAYGCVSVDAHEYFVAPDLPRGTRVEIIHQFDGSMIAQDPQGRQHILDPAGKRQAVIGESYHAMPKTDADRLRAFAIVEGQKIKNTIIPDDLYIKDKNKNVITLPPRGEAFQGNAPAPADQYETAEEAWLYLANSTGIPRGELKEDYREMIDKIFNSSVEAGLPIERNTVLKIHNMIITNLQGDIYADSK